MYGFQLLFKHEHGFWVLGAIFLCTTGAEALYSDLGHCGRHNIRFSWAFVKLALLLNYFGQGAWLLKQVGTPLEDRNPFFAIMPSWFLMFGIAIATGAAIIASQALISGSFTLVAEAIRLYFFPKSRIVYPTEVKGQIYVPVLNLMLLLGCVGVVLYFRESSNMEAAYGLSITITMLMTTILFSFYLRLRRISPLLIWLFLSFYLPIEFAFLVSNLSKFMHGGYVTLFIGGALFAAMWIWNQATRLKRRYTEYVALSDHLDALEDLSKDPTIPKFSTHLVYLTGAPVSEMIESKIIYSIFRKRPKKADVYWFIHVDVVDDPYTTEYEVVTLVPGKVIRIDFSLGFRLEPRINVLFRQVLDELSKNHEVDILSRYDSLRKNNIPGDFRFIVLEKSLAAENNLPLYERTIMWGYSLLKRFALSEERGFGLDTSSVMTEKVPLVISAPRTYALKRVYPESEEF
jgi:KUP system potassium uptake protein